MISRPPESAINWVLYVLLGGVVVVGLALIGWALAVLLHWLDPVLIRLFGGTP